MKKVILFFAFLSFAFSPFRAGAAITITGTVATTGNVQHPYSATLQALGGSKAYTWSTTGTLPTGYILTGNTSGQATLGGTPTAVGVYTFSVVVTDRLAVSATNAYTVTITQLVLTPTQMSNYWNRGTPEYPTLWDTWNSLSGSYATGWSITGNTGLTAGTNFLGTTDATDVVFKRNGSEAIRIYSSNNFLGLGTATPTQKIELLGTNNDTVQIKLRYTPSGLGTNGGAGAFIETDGGRTFLTRTSLGQAIPSVFFIKDDDEIRISANNTEGFKLDNAGTTTIGQTLTALTAGNVGIGTIAPTAKLHVLSTYSVALKTVSSTTTTASHAAIFTSSNGTLFSVRGDGAIATTYTVDASAGDAATIEAPSGRFRKDASGTSFTLTNASITANSIIVCNIATVGLTAGNCIVPVAGSGSAVFTFQSAAGAAEAPNASADVNFWIMNY